MHMHIRLQADWDSVYDDILSSQRQLEVSLVQWTSFEDSYNQLDQWVKSTEKQLSDDLPLHNTLEEKKTQLHTYRVWLNYFLHWTSEQKRHR